MSSDLTLSDLKRCDRRTQSHPSQDLKFRSQASGKKKIAYILQIFILFFNLCLFFNWSIIALQNFVVFYQTSTWITNIYFERLLGDIFPPLCFYVKLICLISQRFSLLRKQNSSFSLGHFLIQWCQHGVTMSQLTNIFLGVKISETRFK